MNGAVQSFSATAFDDYLDVDLELSSRTFLLPIKHDDFCIYTVYLAHAAYHSYHVNLGCKGETHNIIYRVLYRFQDELNFKEYFECKRNISDKIAATKSFVVSELCSGGSVEFIVKFNSDEKEYYFKPEYPHYLNWVYMIACSFKNKTPLEITYKKESSSKYRASHEIVDIKLPDIT
jgi:hypothetical protein